MLEKIFAENDVRANVNRAAFENNGIRALDLMSSPGSGKTTVLGAALDEHAAFAPNATSTHLWSTAP